MWPYDEAVVMAGFSSSSDAARFPPRAPLSEPPLTPLHWVRPPLPPSHATHHSLLILVLIPAMFSGGQELALLTSLTLDTRSVFTSYTHRSPLAADVTFNVKDFRAMTALCTALGADVALRLEVAGAPLVVEPHFRGLRVGGSQLLG